MRPVSTRIDSAASREAAHAHLERLLEYPDRRDLITFAGALEGTDAWHWAVSELRGVALIDGGSALADADMVSVGVAELELAFPEPSTWTAYNIANGHLALWEIPLRHDGLPAALLTARKHLHVARRIFERLGADATADPSLRVQSLVNAGNSYDVLGRDHEALELWARALELRPGFAMAHGNRGIALLHAAPFAGAHATMLAAQAAHELDLALADPAGVRRFGSESALAHFQAARAQLPADLPRPQAASEPWTDPYLAWCREHELFLHASHACLREDDKHLDPLFFDAISGRTGEEQRGDDITDAINAIKQEYASVRYLSWLALDSQSTIADHAAQVKARTRFVDSLTSARWGLRTGIAVQAFVSTTNLLDKLAVCAHAYFRTGRNPRKIFFRSLWRTKHEGQERMEPEFEAAFGRGWNPGLAALCDLATDLEDDTALSRLVAMRHTATHRLLVAHDGPAPRSADWITRISYSDLVDRSLEQIRLARGGIVYLLRAIDTHEERLDAQRGEPYATVPVLDIDPGLSELA